LFHISQHSALIALTASTLPLLSLLLYTDSAHSIHATAIVAAHQLLAAVQARTEEELKEAIEQAHKNDDK